jgi:NADPH:quinone reductase-like Zn-dependent oxidoreductase
MTNTMKAVRIFDFGGPEVLTFADYPMPEVGPHDVRVRIEATSVSGFDLKYRSGVLHRNRGGDKAALPGRNPFPMPMQLGRDGAWIVEAVGKGVTKFKPGDRVVGMTHPANPESIETLRGLGNLSSGVEIPGHTMFGAYAQYVCRPESYWLPLADAVSFDEAACVMWPATTAHRVVMTRLGIKLGNALLVTGATGGMGFATLRLAKLAGATTIATTRDDKKVSLLKANGADHVVVTGGDDAQAIRKLTDGRGVDGAVDYTGSNAVMRLCCDSMRLGGSICLTFGEPGPLPFTAWDMNRLELTVRGVRGGTPADQLVVWELMNGGVLRIPIERVLPLSEAAQAHALQEAGSLAGRIVLRPWP